MNPRTLARTHSWHAVLLLGLPAVLLYFVIGRDPGQSIVYSATGVLCVVSIIYGVLLHRPARPGGWLAMAAANLGFVLGDGILDYYPLVLHRSAPFPSVADALYLAGYPCLVVSVVLLTRGRAGGSSREDRADAAILTVGALAVSWHLLVSADAHDGTLSLFGRVVTMAYPIMDVGVLFIVVNAIFSTRVRNTAADLVAAGLLSMLIADFGYDLLVLHGAYTNGSAIDAFWLISYVLLGAAATHPSMRRSLVRRTDSREARRRLPLVSLAGFVAPLILLVGPLLRARVDVPVLAALSIALFGLVVLRVSWLLHRLDRQAQSLTERSDELAVALLTQQALEEDLRHQAFHDSLTGLANRALLHDRVEHALLSSARSAGTVAVIFCDLDGFKTVNDSLGHQIGDDLLSVIGKRLSSVVRPADTVARLGGDEFAVLLEAADPELAMTAADRIVSVVRQPIECAGQTLRVTASVGVSFGTSAKSVETLLSEADAAMYAAKTAGKNRVASFEEQMRSQVQRRMALRNCFDDALRDGEFHLQYQPHVALADGRLQGFEALVRWRHAEFGPIGPVEFIPLAEETGFIVPLGRWVLEQACLTAAGWPDCAGGPLAVSVNVSARQLTDSHLLDDVRAALGFSGLDPRRLVLEVTEGMLTDDAVRSAAVLGQLRQLGIRIAIDDFGTGYSSLSQLRQFPVDVIKIDKSFVDPLADPSNEGDAFVSMIIGLARQLRLSTVAEGIETDTQRAALAGLGCDSAQGYLMSRPLDEADALHFIRMASGQPGAIGQNGSAAVA
ncbi:MAG TPA: EAL domain-containing protein [Jatrophihabitans sp.]|nr:EAL domain-containing protein [Jatrophihabitans sp.]